MATSKLFLILTTLPGLLGAQTTITLTTTPNPSRFGAPVVLRASIAPGAVGGNSNVATGKVTFYDGVTILGTTPLVPNGINSAASLSTILLPAGNRHLKAYYTGDANHSPTTSSVVTQTVSALPVSNFAPNAGVLASRGSILADVNGDGIPDIVDYGGVHLGDGKGNLNASFVVDLNVYPSGILIAAGDFNGDGKPDVVLLTNRYSGNVQIGILLGNGDGTFQAPVSLLTVNYSGSSYPYANNVVVADFNRDGKADLAGDFGILLGNGDGTFQIGPSLGTSTIYSMVAGDFNGDGIPDLATSDGASKYLSIFPGHGDGTFGTIQVPISTNSNGINLVSADFNGDGKQDLAAVNPLYGQPDPDTLFVFLGQGDGTFQPPVAYSLPYLGGGFVLTADFNGDGIPDLAVNGEILAGKGDGSFQPLFIFNMGGNFGDVLAADLNGDGRPDLFPVGNPLLLGTTTSITASGGTPQSTTIGTRFAAPLEVTVTDNGVPLNGVTVSFSSTGTAATLSTYTAVTDASGKASVTATAGQAPGNYTVTAQYQSRLAPFALTNVAGAPASLTMPGAYPQSAFIDSPFAKPLGVLVKDANGFPVIGAAITFQVPQSGASAVLSSATAVTDTSGAASVTARANHIAGSYTVTASVGGLSVGFQLTNTLGASSSVTLTSGTTTSAFGAPVLLTATVTPSNATGRVAFYDGVTLLGTKPLSGATASLSTILLPPGTHRLHAWYSGDINYASGTSNVVTQQVNAAAGGSFLAQALNAPPLSVAQAGPAIVPVVADFNGDGIADIAYSGTDASNSITVLLGKGDGTFRAAVLTPGVGGAMTVGDFNGDGIPDLFCGGIFGAPNATIFLGKGDGTFRQGAAYPVPNGTIAVADFNGDGNADILIGNVILVGQGDGTFTSTGPLPSKTVSLPPIVTFSVAGDVHVGDLNGDGKADRVTVDSACSTQGGPISGFYTTCQYFLDVYPGNGDGTFQSPLTAASASSTSSYLGVPPYTTTFSGSTIGGFLLGDLTGDGKPDILYWGFNIPFQGSANVVVLPGKGDGTFGSPLITDTGSTLGITSVTTGDFNGDGITDLAVSHNDGTFSILTGRGDGTFQVTVIASSGSVQTAADFNGDGRTDLLVTSGNGNLSLLLGTAASTPVSQLTASGGALQSAAMGSPFPAALQVTATDAGGKPLSGITVTFIAPSVGPTAVLSSSTSVTNASGVASITATAGGLSGSYTVKASAGIASASFSLTNVFGGGTNLALGRTATQGSTYPVASAAASSAVDGNTNGTFGAGSVTATNADPNAWWQVDLGASAGITSLVIWNRTDCCGSRLSDYWVFVSNSPFLASDTPATLQNRAGTFASHQTVPFSATTIVINSQGRYVRVQLSGTDYLSLAEVQVFGTGGAPPPSNLAQGKTATESSTYPGYPSAAASSAVDGNTNGNFGAGSVTATNADPNAWWQVDLGASASISSIVIWNRTDCCGARLSDYWVFVSDTPFLATDTPAMLQNRAGTFASHQTTAPNPSTTITVPIQGRYVRVQLSGMDYLSLAEVQVFGTGAPPPADLAQGKQATQSSTLPGVASAAASSAVDGNTDGAFFDGSVTATNLDANPWWQVDLGASAAVSSIVIWNRTDCCGTRLSDYWVFVSDTPFLATDTPASLQNRAGTFASHQTTAPNPSTTILAGAQGRYVRVQLSGANYLSLAEVQVYGQ
jgi:hypothetical protein